MSDKKEGLGMETNERSRFATALDRLLERLLTKTKWSKLLGISTPAISQWVTDKTVPRPEVLRLVVEIVKARTKLPHEELEEFLEILRIPAEQVSPHGQRIAKTVIHYEVGDTLAHYLVAPVLEGFLRRLSALSPEKQELVLFEASDRCLDIDLEDDISPSEGEVMPVSAENDNEVGEDLLVNEGCNDPDAYVVSGHQLVSFLDCHKNDPHRGLHLVGKSVPLDLVGMFNPEYDNTTSIGGLPTCTVVLWKLPKKEDFLSFPLDEMMFFLLRGRVKWHYKGAAPVSLGIGHDDPRRLWMRGTASDNTPGSLPPFLVETESKEPAIGLAVFYAKSGVKLHQVNGPQVELQTQYWPDSVVSRYWDEVRSSYGESVIQLPAVTPVPSSLQGLDEYLKANAPEDGFRKDVHDPARREGQISDANLYAWDGERRGVLESRIVKFHAAKSPMKEDDIWMGHHDGREIIIPLVGTFKYLVAERQPEDVEAEPWRRCGEFSGRRRGLVQSAEYSNLPFSDLLLLNSSNWHGFSGTVKDAYCLHIRCRAPRHSSSRNSHSSKSNSDMNKAERLAGPRGSAYPRPQRAVGSISGASMERQTNRSCESRHAEGPESLRTGEENTHEVLCV